MKPVDVDWDAGPTKVLMNDTKFISDRLDDIFSHSYILLEAVVRLYLHEFMH